MGEAKIVQVLMHDSVRREFEKWLAERDLGIARVCYEGEDSLETWTVYPRKVS